MAFKIEEFIELKKRVGQHVGEEHDGGGLSIRFRKNAATWTFRARMDGKQLTLAIADIGDLGLRAARERKNEGHDLVRRGIHPGIFFASGLSLAEWEAGEARKQAARLAADKRLAEEAALADLPPDEPEGMLWDEAVAGFLAEAPRRLRPATVQSYRLILTLPDMRAAEWTKRRLSEIGDEDIKGLQNTLTDAGKITAARSAVIGIRQVLKWAKGRAHSGVQTVARDVALVPPSSPRQKRVPQAIEVGKMMWTLDTLDAPQPVRLAVALLILTCQRRETILTAKLGEVVSDPEFGTLWGIPPEAMKGARPHCLPLSPLTSAVMRASMAIAGGDAVWLYPQMRLRRAGDEKTGHMAGGNLNRAMKNMGFSYSPHDMRRAFTDAGERLLGFSEQSTKVILDHAEGLSGDITEKHYRTHQRLLIKADMLRAWEGFVIAQMAAHKEGWPVFLPPVPT